MLSTVLNTQLVHVGKNARRKHVYFTLALYLFFLGIFSSNSIIEQTIGYLLSIFGYIILISVLLSFENTKLSSNRTIFFVVLGISFIFSISTILSLTTSSLLRMILFIPIFILNFIYIPSSVSRKLFYGTLARVTAVLTLMGLPAIIIGPFGPIQAYSVISNPPGFPVALYGLMSIFRNPNTMGALAVYGGLAALWEYTSTNKKYSFAIFLINSLGVYFSQGRAAGLAFFIGIAIVGIYHITNRRGLVATTIIGIISASTVLLIKFGIVPGPDIIRNINLNNRVQLWTAAFQAMLDRPLFGWGLGNVPAAMTRYITRPHLIGADPHMSYIRMFTATGVVGGLLYTYLYFHTMLKRLITVTNNIEATEYALVLGIIIIHMFSGISLFGLSLTSVIPAIVLGYAQKTN